MSMAVYFVVNAVITDSALLAEYMAEAQPVLSQFRCEVLAVDDNSTVIEGEPIGVRTVVLEFASRRDFHEFYDSPQYEPLLRKRLAATDGFAILVSGAVSDGVRAATTT
jgi:uncharacterized protein (DUF1330 family)